MIVSAKVAVGYSFKWAHEVLGDTGHPFTRYVFDREASGRTKLPPLVNGILIMPSCIHIALSILLASLLAEAPESATPVQELAWPAEGLSGTALVTRISQATGQPFVLRSRIDRWRLGQPFVMGSQVDRERIGSATRLYCTSTTLDVNTARLLAERAFGLVGWDLDGTTIWLQKQDSAALVLAAARVADRQENVAFPEAELPSGDIELVDALAEEAIRQLGLAFEVTFVYSNGCVASMNRLSVAMEGVDFATCLSIVTERFDLRSQRLADVVLLEPVARSADGKRLDVVLEDTARLNRQEAARLCALVGGDG